MYCMALLYNENFEGWQMQEFIDLWIIKSQEMPVANVDAHIIDFHQHLILQ